MGARSLRPGLGGLFLVWDGFNAVFLNPEHCSFGSGEFGGLFGGEGEGCVTEDGSGGEVGEVAL